MKPSDFYNQLAPYYHEIFPDWSRSIARQATQLRRIIRTHCKAPRHTVLDASCGIGTQALGLAALGFDVTGSDISAGAVRRARREARRRDLTVRFSVADMRKLWTAHGREFDVVISCDNSIPHLLTSAKILSALRQMKRCTRVGGLCLVSVRDYAEETANGCALRPYGVVEKRGQRIVLFQTWEFHGKRYTMTLYRLAERRGCTPTQTILSTEYFAIDTDTLMRLMRKAGFVDVRRLDNVYYQPVLIGRRRA
jgi:SAM-dependent methyltransferase